MAINGMADRPFSLHPGALSSPLYKSGRAPSLSPSPSLLSLSLALLNLEFTIDRDATTDCRTVRLHRPRSPSRDLDRAPARAVPCLPPVELRRSSARAYAPYAVCHPRCPDPVLPCRTVHTLPSESFAEFAPHRPNALSEPRRSWPPRHRDRPALLPCRDRLATPPRRAPSAPSSLVPGRASPHRDRIPSFVKRLKTTQIFLLTPKSQFELIHDIFIVFWNIVIRVCKRLILSICAMS
jgi:hypothetical protein